MAPEDPHEPHRSSPADLQALNAHQRAGAPFLVWRHPSSGLRFLTLGANRSGASIGRAVEADVSLPWDLRVSGVHAELRPLAGQWLISDDGLSRNGTWIGGERIGAHHRLRDDDRIVVGDTVLVFHAPDPQEPHRAVAENVCSSSTVVMPTRVSRTDLGTNEWRVLCALCAPLVLNTSEEPQANAAIAREVHLSEEGVKRCLTRLFAKFEITDDPKRSRLARRAIATGVVSRRDVS